ncbi:adenylate kinase [Irineochytrium annulatum]|nr:adenylate kinase [Irineochytrium annulatum]
MTQRNGYFLILLAVFAILAVSPKGGNSIGDTPAEVLENCTSYLFVSGFSGIFIGLTVVIYQVIVRQNQTLPLLVACCSLFGAITVISGKIISVIIRLSAIEEHKAHPDSSPHKGVVQDSYESMQKESASATDIIPSLIVLVVMVAGSIVGQEVFKQEALTRYAVSTFQPVLFAGFNTAVVLSNIILFREIATFGELLFFTLVFGISISVALIGSRMSNRPAMLTPPQLPAASDKTSIDNVLDSIPPPKLTPVVERTCYVVIGKPGAGKTSLASRIASTLQIEHINAEALLRKVVGTPVKAEPDDEEAVKVERTPIQQEIDELLASGKDITSTTVVKYMEEAARSEESMYTGYILDGLPYIDGDKEQIVKGLDVLKSLVDGRPQNFRIVLLNLIISSDDVERRKRSQRVDPLTGTVYPGPQVLYSRRRREDGWENGAVDTFAQIVEEEELETWTFDYNMDEDQAGADKGDNEEDDEDDHGDEDDADEDGSETGGGGKSKSRSKRRPGDLKQIRLDNKIVWPIIGKEVLDRLIKRPEDSHERISKELYTYDAKEQEIYDMTTALFDNLSVINVDATQHPDLMFRNVMERLESMGIWTTYVPIRVKRLTPPEGGGFREVDIVNYLCINDLEDGEPPREESIWGRFCPVSFVEEHAIVKSKLSWPVSYRGHVYFISDEERLKKFVSNPDKYLSAPPILPSLQICILGGPFTGKTTQAKMLARLYNLRLLSVDEVMREWDSEVDQRHMLTKSPTYAKIVKRCKAGRSVPPELVIEVVTHLLADSAADSQNYRGWILDGFPRTIDQATALIAAGYVPKHTVVLTNDINDESAVNSTTASKGRKPVAHVEPPEETPYTPSIYTMPPLPVYNFPFFDNLYNGFREEFSAVIKILEDNGAVVVNVAAEQAIPTVLSITQFAIDPFLPVAKALSPQQVAELPTQFEFGMTKDYCPFALRQAKILQKGNPEYAVSYMTVCIEALKQWDIPKLTFSELVKEFSTLCEADIKAEIDYMMRENAGLLSPVIIQDMITSLFKREPYASKGFMLEGFPRTKVDLEVLMKHNLLVDGFVNLNVEPDIAAKRIFADLQRFLKEKGKAESKEEVKPKPVEENKDSTEEDAADPIASADDTYMIGSEVLRNLDRPEDELMDEIINM